ncbi:UDP-N-acetylmuramyl pentapeptide phosphotransferase/UDP-N-acetylglucosamine-1-phosphate transferase [Synechococcus sp. PCC 7502]|uniref:glycosyltransferase family 4 protein n=1 Tax=Synechococcus sp. PCC 7502 TaxID=1173263 RepID=UPI00029FFD3D|nr:MraY family glycosyltransferase [Synechococcus sp. PCC 7502]AFY74318.1 UDP-N-acetylmuramyl pentapeptide phosphotransferase/UDP-N-acetylglucosamine-1-phosphate transferase [Synechococcus sp. PCC 7502]
MFHQDAIPFITAFTISALVVWFSTPIVRKLGLIAGLTDKPNERKMHTTPVVRLGGVSIFLGTLCALLLVWWGGWFGVLPPSKEYEVWGVTIGGVAFFLLGLADDIFQLPAVFRLFMQLLISGIAWWVGVRIEFISIPFFGIIKFGWLSLPITMVWLSGMVNAINWIDGLDGLAAGVTTIASAVLLITSLFMDQPAAALIAAALSGGCLGFLRYNFKPFSSAEIFMGDGGAYYLGFTLAGVSVIGLVKTAAVAAVILPYLILAVPIVDGVVVILGRLLKRESLMSPDKNHLHHRLVRAGISKRDTVLFIYTLTIWAGCLALAISGMPAGGTYAAVSTLVLIYACWKVRNVTQRSSPNKRDINASSESSSPDPASPNSDET